MDKEISKNSFATIADVLDHLEGAGWKVTKTSLYRHRQEGKLLPQDDGSFRLKDVEKYAKAWLKRQSTGKRVSEKMDELQRRRIEMELENLEIQKKRNQFAYEKEINRFVRREEMEIELATRAGILDAGLKHWVKSHAAEWIRLAEGNMQRIGELISKMNIELDEHVNGYATAAEFDVIFEGDNGVEAPEEAEEEEPC